MALIDLVQAKAHLRLEPGYPDDQVEIYLSAAELSVQQFLNRKVYASQNDLEGALEGVLPGLEAASEAYIAAMDEALVIEDYTLRCAEIEYAKQQFENAKVQAFEIRRGIVINDSIKVAILLVLGNLFENREDVVVGMSVSAVQLPMGSQQLLMPYRVGLGV